ncbi:Spy/CpxP family protein refolding chaperone [Legionella sp.]|uniref:Spy/CpxP family protein refolding chaperone n=1 Tax=Legionella sp. TaxID=459 RepID=UPI003CB6FE42
MYKKLLGTLALTCSLAISSAAFAHFGGCGEGMNKMLESIKLDDSQKQKIQPILANLKATMKQSGEQMRDLSKQINDQITSGNMDQSVVNDLIDKKTKLIGDMIKAKVMVKSQIYTLLNAQQKTELQNKMKQKEEQMVEKYKSCHNQD